MPDFRSVVKFNSLQANQLLDWINVKDPAYGAKGDGSTDDTTAIQAAINAATGSANATTTTRTPNYPVYLPKGTYKVTSDLMIRSVNNFRLVGDGPGMTELLASGTGFTQAVLFIDGSADGVFEGFSIQGDGTEKCGSNNLWDGIRLDGVGASRTVASVVTTNTSAVITLPSGVTDAHYYDVGAAITGTGIPSSTTISSVVAGTSFTLSNACTASGTVTVTITPTSSYKANRTTTGNCFRDIRVRALKCVNGLSLEGNGSAQLDGTWFENVVISGSQTAGSWSSSGLYQNGLLCGVGVFANNYDHAGVRTDTSGFYYGYALNASSLYINGCQPAGNFSDFWFKPGGQSSIQNVQSQNSGQFLVNPSGFSPNPVSISDVSSLSLYPQSGNPIITLAGGIWHIKNFQAELINSVPAYVAPVINVNGGGSNSRPCEVVLENIVLNGTKVTCIVPTSSRSNIVVHDYSNYSPTTGNYTTAAGDVLSIYTGSAWVNLDSILTDSDTFTNKRITKRVLALSAASATPAINTDSYDVVHITSQGSTAITSFTTNLTGTPVDGDTLRISIIGTGAVALTWGTSFEASTIALPTTTVANARLDVGFFWNSETSKWRCVGVA